MCHSTWKGAADVSALLLVWRNGLASIGSQDVLYGQLSPPTASRSNSRMCPSIFLLPTSQAFSAQDLPQASRRR